VAHRFSQDERGGVAFQALGDPHEVVVAQQLEDLAVHRVERRTALVLQLGAGDCALGVLVDDSRVDHPDRPGADQLRERGNDRGIERRAGKRDGDPLDRDQRPDFG
jgi:hypothetical protein